MGRFLFLGLLLIVWLVLIHGIANGQVSESFSDGDYTNGISWTGTTAWVVVAGSDVAAGGGSSKTLRLSAISGSGLQYLSTPITGSWGTAQTWAWWMGRRGQAATAANVLYVWL